jgi:hypothetical protein
MMIAGNIHLCRSRRSMAKNIEAPADVEIASLKKQQVRIRNLMEPGAGTPWEDRGSVGTMVALFKSAFAAMFAPRRLLDSMRRLETRADARVLAIIYGVFWGLSWVLHDVIAFGRADESFDMTVHGYAWAIHFILGAAGTFFILEFSSRLFYSLVSAGEMRTQIPQVLVYNVFAYCLGPSIVALIPFGIGPLVALIWIFGLIVFGAVARLAIKPGGAMICGLIAFGGIFGGAVAVYFGLRWLLDWLELIPKSAPTPAPRRL